MHRLFRLNPRMPDPRLINPPAAFTENDGVAAGVACKHSL
jgi:hypothetical protein